MRRPLFAVALCLVVVCAIWIRAGGAKETEDCSVPDSLAEVGMLTITGQVYQKEEDSIYLKSIVISNSKAFGQSAAESRQVYSDSKSTGEEVLSEEEMPGNLICQVNGAEEIPLGTTVMVNGEFVPFSRARNPGEFDARKYYRSIGIVGKLENGEVLRRSAGCWPLREWLYAVKRKIQMHIYDIFSEEDAAVIEALLLGEKGNLDSDLKGLYQRNGILHILSISAMHVSIVGMSIYQLLRKVGMPIWLSAVCGSVVLLLYGALTGFGISAVRAIGMYLLRMLAEVVGRTYDMLTALGLMGMLMVLYNPYYLQNGGFLLSFSCVLGIGVLYPALLPDFGRYQGKNRALDTTWKKWMERIREAEFFKVVLSSFFLSLSVTLATLPVQLYLYYEVPVFSVFLNLLVVPFLKPLLLSGIAALLFPWSIVFEGVADIILKWYELVCGWFDVLPCNTWNPGCPEGWQMVVYYGLLLGVIWWRRVKRRRLADMGAECKMITREEPGHLRECKERWIQVAGCAVMLVLGVSVLGMRSLQSSIIFLDVGQGSCAVIQLASGENYLFDCGSSDCSKVGQYVLLPYLKYAGIRHLDGVFVSHPDEDHSSGVLELFALNDKNDIEVEQLILPDIEDGVSEEQLGELVEAARETRVAYISKGDTWRCDSAKFVCLHPYKDYSGIDSNQYSQCFYVEFLEPKWFGEADVVHSLLLTGDVGKDAEKDLRNALAEYDVKNVTVFQGAHHGSKYSNSQEVLQIVRPKVTVISCGKNNTYGHPHGETLERLKKVGSDVLTTPEYGAVRIEMGKKMRVYGYGK